jgi:hypothetical protein
MVNGFVHSYIGITPDFGSEKRGSTPRWTTKAALAASFFRRSGTCDGIHGIK